MKFGRYLTDNATPEWKRAYIDYRALKKQLKRVTTRMNEGEQGSPHEDEAEDMAYRSSDDDDHGPSARARDSHNTTAAGTPARTRIGTAGPASSTLRAVDSRASAARSTESSTPQQPGPSVPSVPSAPSDTTSGSPQSPLSTRTPSTTYQTPASVRPSKRSPNYGALGTSPRLTEIAPGVTAGGVKGTTAVSGSGHFAVGGGGAGPPPLDLGKPALEPAEANRERLRRKAERAGRGVNFSPHVEAIPDQEAGSSSDEDDGDDADADGEDEPDLSGETCTEVASDKNDAGANANKHAMPPGVPATTSLGHDSSRPDSETTSMSRRSRRKKRKSPSLSAFSPKLSLLSPRAQASVGVSPANTADAPSGARSILSLKLPSPRLQGRAARSFEELYDTLAPDEKAFFDLLDAQLDKVETFYSEREAEATRRYHELRDQLHALAEHRRIFHEQFPDGVPEWEAKVGRVLAIPGYDEFWPQRAAQKLHLRKPWGGSKDDDGSASGRNTGGTTGLATPMPTPAEGNGSSGPETSAAAVAAVAAARDKSKQFDPERYMRYKKELRTAMLEFYRHLELIKNYRILNLTGFRKALKKFEKATHIQCLEMYTEDRILPCSFARGDVIDTLIKQTEELFTEHFEHGDMKRARDKLRQGDQPQTHYYSVFRSGIMLGLGLPVMVLAIIKSFEDQTRREMPYWGALLYLYGGLLVPVVFGIIFELNLVAWVDARINYEFVMELSRPVTDYRSFLEMPAFFFLTLSYCFFFSFFQVGKADVAPTTWPLAWLVMVCAFFLNPLPIFRRRARWWFLKVLARVCTPGYSRVEFIAFFVADELNSLVFTVQNIFFMGCVYSKHWPGGDTFKVCPTGTTWPYALLACLPPLARLIQCLKRYYDSRLYIHLINGGKYCSSILQACLFVWWRGQDKHLYGAPFIIWVLFAAFSSTYNSLWDLVVDWSLLRPGCRGLRRDLGYGNKFVYYWAMVTDVLIRFIWIWYIPKVHHNTKLRSFIFAIFEMLRRWQWNFFRVETEHLGNADAYRVTREIPLPYRSLRGLTEDDDASDDAKKPQSVTTPIVKRLRSLRAKLVGSESHGRGQDALNVGARGHADTREYEARRPGDIVRSPSRRTASSAA